METTTGRPRRGSRRAIADFNEVLDRLLGPDEGAGVPDDQAAVYSIPVHTPQGRIVIAVRRGPAGRVVELSHDDTPESAVQVNTASLDDLVIALRDVQRYLGHRTRCHCSS